MTCNTNVKILKYVFKRTFFLYISSVAEKWERKAKGFIISMLWFEGKDL